jgi:hypothetical protein
MTHPITAPEFVQAGHAPNLFAWRRNLIHRVAYRRWQLGHGSGALDNWLAAERIVNHPDLVPLWDKFRAYCWEIGLVDYAAEHFVDMQCPETLWGKPREYRCPPKP